MLVTLRNTGAREGASVVQIYVGYNEASVPRPAKELKDLTKVAMQPGENRRRMFRLVARDFSLTPRPDASGGEAGEFIVMAGFSSNSIWRTGAINLSGLTLHL